MAYRAYRSDRRFRRRRWLLIAVSLVAIIAVIAFLASRQTEQRGAVEFYAAADESSDGHGRSASELESALTGIGTIERQDLTRRLENVVSTAREADALLDVEVPASIGVSYGTMATASSSWTQGVEAVQTTVVAIADGVLVEGAQEQLQAALDMLRVGDTSHALFIDALSDVPEDVDVPAVRPVNYINPDAQDPLLYDAQALVLRIQTSYDLSPHHDVSVSGMTVPKPVGTRGEIPVVPFAANLDIQVVITNLGNEDEASVEVVLEVFAIETEKTTTATQQLTDLAASASTTITFTDLELVPGGLYQAKVVATIPEDIDLDNDTWDMTFIWNAES